MRSQTIARLHTDRKEGLDLDQRRATRGMNPQEWGHIRRIMQNTRNGNRPRGDRRQLEREWRLSLNQEFADRALAVVGRIPRTSLVVVLNNLSSVIVVMLATVGMIVVVSVGHTPDMNMGVAVISAVPNRV